MNWRIEYKSIAFIIILSFFLLPSLSLAFENGKCSKDGYSVITINGIFTDERQANQNKDSLAIKLGRSYNNQEINFQYLLNATHLGGLKDLTDVAYQKYYENEEVDDYDLQEMLSEASNKILTEKVLLVGHSQGNFYANSFYKKVAHQEGPIAPESISVYAVATPASYVAGQGLYTTSDTDSIISGLVGNLLNHKIMTPNVHIPKEELGASDGHDFAEVYLQYQAPKIISDIKLSLSKLSPNHIQNPNLPCLSMPVANLTHSAEKVVLNSLDPILAQTRDVWNSSQEVGVATRNLITNYTDKMYAYFSGKGNAASVILSQSDDQNNSTNTDTSSTSPTTEPANTVLGETKTQNSSIKINITDSKSSASSINPNTEISKQINPATTTPTISNSAEIIPVASIEEPILHPDLLPGGGGMSAQMIAAIPQPITIIPDTTAPVITILGSSASTIALNSVYVDAGATAVDDVDGVVTPVVTGSVDTSTAGIYIITYTATDTANNVSTATRLVRVDSGAALDGAHSVFVSGNYAYVVSDHNSFEIINISNPSHPRHISYLKSGDGGAELFAPKGVYVSGDNAFVLSYSNALEVIDVSNKFNPRHKATLLSDDALSSLKCPVSITGTGNYAYIASYNCGNAGNLAIIDISDPAHPSHVGDFYNGTALYPTSVFVSGIYAYITSTNGDMDIVDISNPAHPVIKGAASDGIFGVSLNNSQSVFVDNGNAYVASRGTQSLEVIDVSDPAIVIHKGVLHNGDGGAELLSPQSLSVSGNYAYIVSFVDGTFEVVNISDPAHPVHTASLNDGSGGALLTNPTFLAIDGNYAYVTSQNSDSLEIIDISNPANPTHAGSIINGGF